MLSGAEAVIGSEADEAKPLSIPPARLKTWFACTSCQAVITDQSWLVTGHPTLMMDVSASVILDM
jgi:hypothetical protein